MFQHLTIFFSFIFAIAFTHILASASALVVARRRVRFSGLLTVWMFIFANYLLMNWVGLFSLASLKRWSIGEVLIQVMSIVPQYFICSLISMKVRESGEVDMNAYFEEQRPLIFSIYAVFGVTVMLGNYLDRNNVQGPGPNDWIGADLLNLPGLVVAAIAGWAKSRKLQWVAVGMTLVLTVWFYWSYTGVVIQSAPAG